MGVVWIRAEAEQCLLNDAAVHSGYGADNYPADSNSRIWKGQVKMFAQRTPATGYAAGFE